VIRTSEPQKVEMEQAAGRGNLRWNEKVWTLLVADAIERSPNKANLISDMCGAAIPVTGPLDLWFEAQPLSPRGGRSYISEGNTHLDLALGHVCERHGTDGGIRYGPHRPGAWVCFVEAKCLSDCSVRVTFDPLRNQLARVIENLLCFQTDGAFPERLFFTLLTPRLFKDNPAGRRSRLYAYKMAEYREHPELLVEDLNACCIPRRDPAIDLEERVSRLSVNWVTFESMLQPDWNRDLNVAEVAMKREIIPDLGERVRLAASRLATSTVNF